MIGLLASTGSDTLDHRRFSEDAETMGSSSPTRLLDAFPDVKPAPIIGPSIVFAGTRAGWTGDDKSNRGMTAHEARVNFQTGEGERAMSHLQILNEGTTAIYYNWKKVFKPNHFDIKRENIQRFYFNKQNGVILPGDTLSLDLTFKSPQAGIYSETWQFE